MLYLKYMRSLVIVSSLILLQLYTTVFGDTSKTAAHFLKIVNDPGAVAMGNCAVNNIDAQSALYNPGAMGLFHFEKNFSISLPNNTMYLKELTDNLRLKTISISGGITLKQLNKSFHHKFNASLSFAYSRQKISYGEIEITNTQGEELGTNKPFEKASNYSIGLGLEYYARIGIGMSIKKVNSSLSFNLNPNSIERISAKTTGYDLGVIFELPLGEIIPIELPLGARNINFDLIPSYAYVQANSGNDLIILQDRFPDINFKLPKISRKGYSVFGSINLDESSLFSYRLVSETEEDLVNEDVEDIEKNGSEIGFLGIFYYRWGKYEDRLGPIDIKTSGYAINLKNIIKWFDTVGPGYNSKTARYISDHFDFIFEYASYDDEEYEVLSNTSFIKINFSI